MANFGGFLRGKNVNVGDFPERDLMDSDDDDENDAKAVKGVQNLSLAEEQAKGKVGGGSAEEEEEEDEI